MLAMGVHAAARLAAKTDDREFTAICRYLLYAPTLRMMHWFDDRTTADVRRSTRSACSQACAAISYSAIFENVETLAHIAPR